MCADTNRAKPYQLALFIKKCLDDIIGTQLTENMKWSLNSNFFSDYH